MSQLVAEISYGPTSEKYGIRIILQVSDFIFDKVNEKSARNI